MSFAPTLNPLQSAGEESDDHVDVLNDVLKGRMAAERFKDVALVQQRVN